MPVERSRPSEEWGRQAVDLWRSATGGTIQDLAKEIERKKSTVERLQRGDGNLEIAIRVRRALIKAKVDVSKLPPLEGMNASDDDDEGNPSWLQEWIWIGKILEEHSKPEWWSAKFAELKRYAEALDLQAREVAGLSSPTNPRSKR